MMNLNQARQWFADELPECCGEKDESGTCFAPACSCGTAFLAIDEAADRITQLEADLAAAQSQVEMLRTGDTCARQCEGTAYRIEARQLAKDLAAAQAEIKAVDELAHRRGFEEGYKHADHEAALTAAVAAELNHQAQEASEIGEGQLTGHAVAALLRDAAKAIRACRP